ncbi:beta-N-acetylhexosaminidase [Nonlabens ulvanivorans]|uniref:beta-N-acetylhexosaminidase n=1 Tax=Nonlabens ulvanivorans TaxID=906888 RepID=A0A084JVK3_NONUL|nr:family 20 glycosylhydrolase [Nonlabens ulvanivorans]KEZ92987.1 beta-N-acetylhexosaminidase [Nonlabens ulvanivorans]PRX12783.1 hexosaminidase [Nonlabens ulvanivorans]
MSARFLILCSLILTLFSCAEPQVKLLSPSIIPAPQSLQVNAGHFTINEETTLSNNDDFTASYNFLNNFLEHASGRTWKTKYSETNSIILEYDDSISSKEGYSIESNEHNITIKASTDAGAFYAVQSLLQLMPVDLNNTTEIHIPAITIKDEPRFKYRGMHLDVSRHMYDVEFIKKYINAMAMLKMNNFHWHFTDDQGWRIEIKKYPRLQEVAAYRDSTLLGHYNDTPHQYDGKKYGGFYTQEEVHEVIAFAKARHINVIPEIEMPGHAQAAIAAYPELGCTGENVQVAMKWGVFEDIYCPSEETFTFLENVLDEVMELFPSKYIHIGGDEAPKTQWKTSDVAQQVIKENGLKDEHELQSYFIQRMEKYLNSKGRQIIGWDEILEGGLAPNATVMSWRGTNGAVEAAKARHDVIMTPTSHAYFDYYQSENDDEPLAIGGFLPLEKVYNFNPIPQELNDEEAIRVLGVQGNVWTEYMTTSEQVEYMAFPRMLAMSEVAWSADENKNYDSFINRVEYFHKRLDEMDINYANHLYEIEGTLNENQAYELSTKTIGKEIRFTTDGSEPDSSSTVYEAPIPFTADMTLKAQVFDDDEPLGRLFTQEFLYHKGVGATISINKEPHKSYPGSGANGLVNGIKGSDSRYGDSEWLGFWGEDLKIRVDFEQEFGVNEIELRFYHAPGQWIYAPNDLKISSDPHAPFSKIKPVSKSGNFYNYKIDLKVASSAFILLVPNYGTIPDGHQGAGNKAWTFIDEIIIK